MTAPSQRNQQGLSLAVLMWAMAVLPLLTSHVSYVVAASFELAPWCNPYWDSCTSISATGRHMPAAFVFRFGMIPSALLAMTVWWCLWRWGRVMGIALSPAMPLLGSIAGLCLICYTLALGEAGDSYRLLRRIGVVLAFALTFIAQLLLTRLIKRLSLRYPEGSFRSFYHPMLGWQLLLLAVGILSVILDALMGDDYDHIEDAFEWWMALLLNGYFVLVARLLQREPARLDVFASMRNGGH